MTDQEWQSARAIVAFRLIGLSPSCVAAQTGIGITTVKRILLQHGNVPPRGPRGHHWKGPYSITETTADRLRLPSYIPRSVDGCVSLISNQVGWMMLTRDMPIERDANGNLHPVSGDEPFYADQGFSDAPPAD